MEAPDHPALRSSLITYLGNKRRLLPLISAGFTRVRREIGAINRVAEPFAGSGVVGRMARIGGCAVHSNDIEEYTRPFGRAFLEVNPDEIDGLFGGPGGYGAALGRLNSLTEPNDPAVRYFSRHYAPRSTAEADPDSERLFFTRENALKIDAMLEAIHERSFATDLARDILLAGVLVEMSIHNNTSGVMKGFHRGWGGRGADALPRILSPVRLEPLPFIDGPRGTVSVGDAAEVFRDAHVPQFDLAYLDPPYTIHQYGANYHLLTSAVRWDRYDPGPVAYGSRAGIRRDHTRSEFCRRSGDRARRAFEQTVDAINARALLVSYNNDGIIPPEELVDILSEDGANTLILTSDEYHKFRGGKGTQSALTTTEFLYLVIRGRRQTLSDRKHLVGRVRAITIDRSIRNTTILPERWREVGGSVIEVTGEERGAPLRSTKAGAPRFRLEDASGNQLLLDSHYRVRAIAALPSPEELLPALERSRAGKVEVCEALIRAGSWREALTVLRTLKIAKYRSEFERLAAKLARTPLAQREKERLQKLTERVLG